MMYDQNLLNAIMRITKTQFYALSTNQPANILLAHVDRIAIFMAKCSLLLMVL